MTAPDLTCAVCGQTKPPGHFNQQARSKTGYAASCRTCSNAKRRARKPASAANGTRVKTRIKEIVKKGDLEGLKAAWDGASSPSPTALLEACVSPFLAHPKKEAHAQIVPYLIGRGADPDARGGLGEPFLCLAAKSGRADLVEALIAGGATVDFYTACAVLDLPAVQRFLADDAALATRPDPSGLSGLHYCAGSALGQTAALRQRQLGLLALLLDAGADPDLEADLAIPVTPLVSCCQSGGSVEVVAALTAAGADPNHRQALRSVLREFKSRRKSQGTAPNPMADALLEAGAQVDAPIDETGRTCLHLYSHHEEIQAVAWLLERGASVAARQDDGRTPLHLAAERNSRTTVVGLLLQKGADPGALDALGKRPIDYARENGKERIVDLLAAL